MTDQQVLLAQKWVNSTYTGVSPGYVPVEEDGITGWRTVWALTRALQIELSITALSDNFGATTESRFTSMIGSISPSTPSGNVVRILRAALWCKGYPGGTVGNGTFDDQLAASCVSMKRDMGLSTSAPDISAKLMKSILTMDGYVTSTWYGGTARIRQAQQWLNETYLHRKDFYVVPCDGVFSRDVQKALMFAIQYELGMADGVANGTFGPGTQSGLKASGTVGTGSVDGAKRFVRLFQAALIFNAYTPPFDGTFLASTKDEVLEFQEFTQLPSTGRGDYATWASLLVSTGDPDRRGTVADTNKPLTPGTVATLYDAGYRAVGRYLSVASKRIAPFEIRTIHQGGLKFFPVFQEFANAPQYFSKEIGVNQGKLAQLRARQLGIAPGAVIYFSVDFDATGGDIEGLVIPYFEGVRLGLGWAGADYRVGVYGARNVCQKVSQAGLAVSSWSSGIPRGWSGNLGFSLPDNWAYDQIQTLTVGSGTNAITIDKNIGSPRAEPLGAADVLPTPDRMVTTGGTTAPAFDDFFWQTTSLCWEAEGVLEQSGIELLVRPLLNDFVLHYLQKDGYWDTEWKIYTPLKETIASFVTVIGPVVAGQATELRSSFYSSASGLPPEGSYEGDIPHLAASTRAYMMWMDVSTADRTSVGDLGGWALDLVTLWAQYAEARWHEPTVRVSSWFAERLGTTAEGSTFGSADLVSDVDAYLVYRRISGTNLQRPVSDALREIRVAAQTDPRWRYRTFLDERFDGSAANVRSAVRDLFENHLFRFPVNRKIDGHRRPGEEGINGELITQDELDAEMDAVGRAFSDRLFLEAGR